MVLLFGGPNRSDASALSSLVGERGGVKGICVFWAAGAGIEDEGVFLLLLPSSDELLSPWDVAGPAAGGGVCGPAKEEL